MKLYKIIILYCSLVLLILVSSACSATSGQNNGDNGQDLSSSQIESNELAAEEDAKFNEYLESISSIPNFEPHYMFVFAFEKIDDGVSNIPIEKVRALYNELNTKFDYVVIAEHPLCYVGYYDGDTAFVDGYTEYLNSNSKDISSPINIEWYDFDGNKTITTPLKTIMIGENTIGRFDDYIEEGRNIQLSDYIIKDENSPIHIVLGNKYKGIYEIGDSIQLELISKVMNFEVVGFYKPDVSLLMDVGASNKVDFDYAITMPFVTLDYEPVGEAAKWQHGFLAGEKATGTIAITEPIAEIDDSTFEKYSKLVEEAAKQNGLDGVYVMPYYPVGYVWPQ